MISRDYFKGKRIAVMGLGQNGEMMADVKFLIKSGALVSIYDLKSEARLKSNLVQLRTIGLANYVCGDIPHDDLLDMDMILLSHEYPRESTFLKGVKDRNIPIEYPETLFFKVAPPVTLVGVLGPCGKSTVISMLAPILEHACEQTEGQGFFVLDHESADGILASTRKVRSGDIILMRISDDLVQEMKSLRISPYIALFTGVSTAYVAESSYDILEFQTYNNYIIANDSVIDRIKSSKSPKAKLLRTKATLVPEDWAPITKSVTGKKVVSIDAVWRSHDRENAALALQAARLFKVDDEVIRNYMVKWKPLKGRLELFKKNKDIEFYNDCASTNSCATETAITTVSDKKNVVLIFGGAKSGSRYDNLYGLMKILVKTVVLVPGSGTMVERANLLKHSEDTEILSAPDIEEAARMSLERAQKGDKVVFSPGFQAGGMDGSRRDRGERFIRAVKGS